MKRAILIAMATVSATACSWEGSGRTNDFTLYRNSALDRSVRVHWATFDANESDRNYNRNNCEMAARLLNANVDASARAEEADRDPSVGFWCEPGPYAERGKVPSTFPGAFPTDA